MKLDIEKLAGSVPRYLTPYFANVEPIHQFMPRPRTREYDRGRVAHFRDLYASGRPVDDLDVMVMDDGQYVLMDGHHRLAGAIWAGVPVVEVNLKRETDLEAELRQ